MPRKRFPLPKCVELVWGADRLEILDPTWIERITSELETQRKSADAYGVALHEPYSASQERIQQAMTGRTTVREAANGFLKPTTQPPVAAEALRFFLGLELPASLNFKSSWMRSGTRITAVHAMFEQYSFNGDVLALHWIFSGFQLYSTHQIGSAYYRPFSSTIENIVERRLLTGQWVRWSFDGASTPPKGRSWSGHRRYFALGESGISRLGSDEDDLWPVYDNNDEDDDSEAQVAK